MIEVSELSFQGSEFWNHINYTIGDVSFSIVSHVSVGSSFMWSAY